MTAIQMTLLEKPETNNQKVIRASTLCINTGLKNPVILSEILY